MGTNADGSWDGKGVPPIGPTGTPRPDQTGQIALGYDGQWHYITWDASGQEHLSVAVAPPPASTTGSKALTYDEQMALATAPRTTNGTSSSTSFNSTPTWVKTPAGQFLISPTGQVLQSLPLEGIDPGTQAQIDASIKNNAANNAQSGANTQAQIAGSAANTATQEAGANSRNSANIFATASNQQNQQAFTGAQSAQGLNAAETNQLRSLGASAIDNSLARAAQAGQFAADYSLKIANQQMADRQAALGAAKTFSDLSGSADLTGYDRFLAAGGGSLGGALQRRATSLTDRGQLGAARALQVAEQPLPAYAPYTPPTETNPYAQYIAPVQYQSVAPQVVSSPVTMGGGGTGGGGGAPAPAAPSNAGGPMTGDSTPGVIGVPASGAIPANVSGTVQWQPSPGYDAAGNRFAYGTGALGRRTRSGVATPPMGAGMDSLTGRFAEGTRFGDDRYATGSFMTGDSTDAIDPAAGGAHPEQVNLGVIEQPGPDKPVATVDPLVPPGVGPTGSLDGDGMDAEPDDDRTAQLGALLQAIGKFLAAPTEPAGMPVNRMALGTRRYALGTDGQNPITPEDQPYIDRVMAMRQATPGGYDLNPYAASYLTSQLPTQRNIGAAAFQTATGVPKEDLAATANYYQPVGLSRDSPYRSLQLGQ